MGDFANQLIGGPAADVMAGFPDNAIDLVITSPPYWTAVTYDGGCPAWRRHDAGLVLRMGRPRAGTAARSMSLASRTLRLDCHKALAGAGKGAADGADHQLARLGTTAA
jgi:hypothetical protein